MSEQVRKTKTTAKRDTGLDHVDESPAEAPAALDDDIDAILDEIDDVLETNAQDFVKAFVQRGGQ